MQRRDGVKLSSGALRAVSFGLGAPVEASTLFALESAGGVAGCGVTFGGVLLSKWRVFQWMALLFSQFQPMFLAGLVGFAFGLAFLWFPWLFLAVIDREFVRMRATP